MQKELKKLNFKNLLLLDEKINAEEYEFREYLNNKEHILHGYCLRCEELKCNVCPGNPEFKLINMSHGASTEDFIQATGKEDLDFSDWHNEGVLFLMEGPSNADWGLYNEVEYRGFRKRPARLWYWVHEKQKDFYFPEKFKGMEYGYLFNSLIFTFKLKNAYFTNLIKCGLNNPTNDYRGINEYDTRSIENCYENFLSKEIEIMNPKIIFCFGSSVYDKLWNLYPGDFPFPVISLPHPARQRSGFKDEFYCHLYFSMILEGLYRSNIYSLEEAEKKYREFLLLKV